MKIMMKAFAGAADLRDDPESEVTGNSDQRDICTNRFVVETLLAFSPKF